MAGALACAAVLFGAGLPRAFARSHKQGKAPRLSQTRFMTMKPFTVPLFKDGRVVEHFTLMVSLELADADRRTELFHLTPKLRDTMYRTLYRIVTFRRKGSPLPHVDIFKQNLLKVVLEVAGDELVASLLVQQAFRRVLN